MCTQCRIDQEESRTYQQPVNRAYALFDEGFTPVEVSQIMNLPLLSVAYYHEDYLIECFN